MKKWMPSIIKGIVLVLVLSAAWSRTAQAQYFTGYMELDYNYLTTRDVNNLTGTVSKSSADSFLERYSLGYRTNLYPYLQLSFGYLYEQAFSAVQSSDATMRSSAVKMSPYVDLSLNNPDFNAGTHFQRTEQRQSPGGANQITDVYSANFNLRRREHRPTLTILASRSYFYDKDRSAQDTVADATSLSSAYTPVENLDLGYLFTYNTLLDRLTDVRTHGMSNSGRASYSTNIFDRRISIDTHYRILYSTSETRFPSGGGTGTVTLSVATTQGIAGLGPSGSITPPETPLFETMVSKPLLIDGDTTTPTDVNIGYSLNQNPRSMGVVVAAPTDMNLLYVVLNQDISALAGSFVWDVYISTDRTPIGNGPKQWTLLQQGATAVFNPFNRRFEISFPDVQAQFIKVVTRPLSSPLPSPPIDINNILVTELLAFHQVSAAEAARETTGWAATQNYDAAVNAKILDGPFLLYYNFFYAGTETNTGTSTGPARRFTLSNGLTALRSFGSIFSASARVSRDDIGSNAASQPYEVAYGASVSLTATPLPTLSHNLLVSEQRQYTGSKEVVTQSAILSNAAQLYQGVSLSVTGQQSSTSESDTENVIKASSLTESVSLTPNPQVSITLNHADTATKQYGRDVAEISQRDATDSVSLSYTPVPAIALSASYAQDKPRDAQRTAVENYSAYWSPFPGGRLVLSVGYNESIALPSHDKTTQVGPSVQWRINDNLYLISSYLWVRVATAADTVRSENTSVSIRWVF